MLNVGWLGSDSAFKTGPVLPGLVDALLVLATDQQNVTRGWHDCEFCGVESPIVVSVPGSGESIYLGHAELHVRGVGGEVYAAPTLVIHYVAEHGYRPPSVFQDAVLTAVASGGFARWART